MTSTRCVNCNLINWATDAACRRCDTSLGVPSPSYAFSETDAWQDNGLLVQRQEVAFLDGCFKCNSPKIHVCREFTLKYQSAGDVTASVFVSLLDVLLMLLIGAGGVEAYYRNVKVSVPLCQRHARLWVTGLVFLAIGLTLLLLCFSVEDSGLSVALLMVGLTLFAVGCFRSLVVKAPVSIKRIDGPFMWLKKVDDSYLRKLPRWPGLL